jgi:hypothetical protein
LRSLSCRRALGLLLMDWTSECSTTPSVNSEPAKRLHLSSEMLARVREGCSYHTKCTKYNTQMHQHLLDDLGKGDTCGGSCGPKIPHQMHQTPACLVKCLRGFVRAAVTAPNAPNAPTPCVGVAPLGLELGVLNHSPGLDQAQWETLFVKGDTCGGSCGSK